jgi:hypothetical protein
VATENFPIMLTAAQQREWPVVWRSLPFDFVAEHRSQLMANHDQSVERLAERGGLALQELAVAIEKSGAWKILEMGDVAAIAVIDTALRDWERRCEEAEKIAELLS